MSFRHPFITDFIYQASKETIDANSKVKDVLEEHGAMLTSSVDERGYGYYAGLFRSSSTYMQYHAETERMIYELSRVTKIPFRLTILHESGPVMIYSIEPSPSGGNK